MSEIARRNIADWTDELARLGADPDAPPGAVGAARLFGQIALDLNRIADAVSLHAGIMTPAEARGHERDG